MLTHMINTIFILSNFFVSAKPIRVLHFYQVLLVATVYVVFSVIYQVSGGSAIYTVLDWDNVKTTLPLTFCLVCIALPLTHFMLYGMYRLRIFIYSRCCATTKIDPMKTKDKETDILQMRF